VKHQYSGAGGGIDNCQVGVFLAYATDQGTAFIDRELFLPEDWANDPKRRQAARVPAEVAFQTKPQIALRMLVRTLDAGVQAAWVTGDSVYSSAPLRRELEQRDQPYVLAVTLMLQLIFFNQRGYLQQKRVSALFRSVRESAWKCLSVGAGSKGERVFDWAWLRLNMLGVGSATARALAEGRGFDTWVLARRTIEAEPEITYNLVFAPLDVTLADLARVAGSRWRVEVAFEAVKQEAGLAEYRVRS
jgi:SRSO17 transposase